MFGIVCAKKGGLKCVFVLVSVEDTTTNKEGKGVSFRGGGQQSTLCLLRSTNLKSFFLREKFAFALVACLFVLIPFLFSASLSFSLWFLSFLLEFFSCCVKKKKKNVCMCGFVHILKGEERK